MSSGSRSHPRLRPHHRPSAGPHLEGRRLAPDPTAVLLVAFDLALVMLALVACRYG